MRLLHRDLYGQPNGEGNEMTFQSVYYVIINKTHSNLDLVHSPVLKKSMSP